MLTFGEYLVEERINYNVYGSWINAKTREVLSVKDFQHNEVMNKWISKQPEGKLKDLPKFASRLSGWAKENGWVRVVHDGNDYNLDGEFKDIKKIWRMVAKQFMKQWLSVDLYGSGPFKAKTFNLEDPKERNEWLGYVK